MVVAANLALTCCYVGATLLLYRAVKPLSAGASVVAALFAILGCAVAAFTSLFHVAASLLTRGARYLDVLQSLAEFCLKLRTQGYYTDLALLASYCAFIAYQILRFDHERNCHV